MSERRGFDQINDDLTAVSKGVYAIAGSLNNLAYHFNAVGNAKVANQLWSYADQLCAHSDVVHKATNHMIANYVQTVDADTRNMVEAALAITAKIGGGIGVRK